MQAIQEIMLAQGMDELITLKKLKRLQKQAMLADHLEELDIEGLTFERALVFPSGLSILIAVFELFSIESMTLAGGALREGLVYDMADDLRCNDIRARTINSIQARFQIDADYSEQVANVAQRLINQCSNCWISERQGSDLMIAAAKLHELGLSIDFKKGGEHGSYLLRNLDLPGFTRAQKRLLADMVQRYRDQLTPMPEQHAISTINGVRALRLLRLAVLLTHRRNPELEPEFNLENQQDSLTLSIPSQWLEENPLTSAELEIEANRQSDLGWPLTINAK